MNKVRSWAAICLICVLFCAAIGMAAQTFTTLVNFDGTNGEAPEYGSLVQGFNGDFYGITYYGGTESVGTVFEVTSAGKLTTLHSFDNTPDGAYPVGGLVQATNGNLYGTTAYGGTDGDGTVFQITTAGKVTILHSFDDTDGDRPVTAPVQATNGTLYGTTYLGGTDGDGTVFEITTAGKFTSLLSFDGTDGASPDGSLIQATDGNLYGTTSVRGDYNCGTLFKVSTTGKLTTLYNFGASTTADGCGPESALVQAGNGNFYGTTESGGGDNVGIVFEITSAGKETTLVSFDNSNGAYPTGGVILATNGNFYGTTDNGGAHGDGTIFEFSSADKLTTSVSFDNTNGYEPLAGLLQATTGTFYGTTYQGGTESKGTVYSLSEGLGPFVETLPTSGAVGTAVTILGNNLTDATSVTFNGKTATFKVVSSTEITTNVPTGATTGKVVVKTPSTTLSSNVNFNVT